MTSKDIPRKANRVLYFVMLALLLIFVRIWYLQTSMREVHLKRARAPRQRTLIQRPTRGAIFDRFGKPLAVNQIEYSAAINYAQIREIPRVRWEVDENGKRCKVFARKQHITALSQFLAKELGLNPQDVEDRIHSRAALFPNTPYIVASGISEKMHAKLKMQERLYPGLIAMLTSKRSYPNGAVGADVIGYMGAITERHYLSVAEELEDLEAFLQARAEGLPVCLPPGFTSAHELKNRYEMLKSQAYTINDLVGKAGCEKMYDELLRGTVGKQPVELDVRGQIARTLPGAQAPLSGQTLTLALSKDLQSYAEELLTISETVRDKNFANAGADNHLVPNPWIKGGAIVAMIPQTGEVVALATHPNFDPNDFIAKSSHIHRWLESPEYIAAIWDGKEPMKKQGVQSVLTWPNYLDRILSSQGQVRKQLAKMLKLKQAVEVQEIIELLLHFSGQDNHACLINALYPNCTSSRNCPPESDLRLAQNALKSHPQTSGLKKRLDHYLLLAHHNDDKLLILDLTRLICDRNLFNEELITALGFETLEKYRLYNQAATRLLKVIEAQSVDIFHNLNFAIWRQNHFADYLKQQRLQEKKEGKKFKPYLDYLLDKEQELFNAFWQQNRYTLLHALITSDHSNIDITHLPFLESIDLSKEQADCDLLAKRLKSLAPDMAFAYLKTMRTHKDLTEPLWGKYRLVKSFQGIQQLKHLASAFYPPSSFGYSKSYAYRQSAPPGSVFKIATAYAGLKQHYQRLPKGSKSLSMLNPLTIFDETNKGNILGKFLDGTPIPRLYKGGRIPKSFGAIGRVDLLTALERSSNVYFALLAGDGLSEPTDLASVAKELGYGAKTGIDLPYEYSGILPSDLRDNRTGLYSFAIGQHAFDGTPLQTAVMLSALANGGDIVKPHILKQAQGPIVESHSPLTTPTYPFQKALEKTGIHFCLFTKAVEKTTQENTTIAQKTCLRSLFMPPDLRAYLLEGLHRVVNGPLGSARPGRIKALAQNPSWKRDYLAVKNTLAGKTSTAEFRYHPTLDRESEPITCKHASFGGIAFAPDRGWDEPELVVVVSLRFGDYGKEAAPLAALIVKKWRELKNAQLSEQGLL